MGQQVRSARILSTAGTEECSVSRIAVRKVAAGMTFVACLIEQFEVL